MNETISRKRYLKKIIWKIVWLIVAYFCMTSDEAKIKKAKAPKKIPIFSLDLINIFRDFELPHEMF